MRWIQVCSMQYVRMWFPNTVITLFRSRSLFRLSSFLWSLAGRSDLSERLDSPVWSPFFFSKARSLSFLASSCLFSFLKVFSRSLLLRRSSSCRLRRSFSLWRRSFSRSPSRSLSRSGSRSLNSFLPSSSPLCVKHKSWVFCSRWDMHFQKPYNCSY